MAKPRKPYGRNIKQGQTLYSVYFKQVSATSYDAGVVPYFIQSQKAELPPEGQVIRAMPVDYARAMIAQYGNRDIFFSRRQAISHMKNLAILFKHPVNLNPIEVV